MGGLSCTGCRFALPWILRLVQSLWPPILCAGLNRLSFFAASDFFDHFGTITRAAIYLIMWYSFASPRAVIWQMYLVSLGVVYCCAGTAYLLSQVRGMWEC